MNSERAAVAFVAERRVLFLGYARRHATPAVDPHLSKLMDDEEDAPAKRRPWGPEEDAQLRKLVILYGIKSGGADMWWMPCSSATGICQAKEHAQGYCSGIALGLLFASPAVAWRHRHVATPRSR